MKFVIGLCGMKWPENVWFKWLQSDVVAKYASQPVSNRLVHNGQPLLAEWSRDQENWRGNCAARGRS